MGFSPRNDGLQVAIEHLVKEAMQAEWGQLFSFAELMAWTGVNRQVLYSLVSRANRALLEDGRLLVNRRNEGYIVATDMQKMDHAMQRRKRGNRQYGWGHRELQAVDAEALSSEHKRAYFLRLAQMGAILDLSRKRTLQGLAASQKAVQHQQEALRHLERMDTLLKTLRAQFGAGVRDKT